MKLKYSSILILILPLTLIGVTFGKEYGEPCDDINHCNTLLDLKCEKNVCVCAEPSFMIYDEDREKCISLATPDGNCYLEPIDGVERDCISNADCLPNAPHDFPYGVCECDSGLGYVAYEDNTCGPIVVSQGYAERCNGSHFCNSEGILWCNDTTPPVLDGQCVCAEEATMIFDTTSNSCLSLADTRSSCHFESIRGVQRKCIRNAECTPNPIDSSGKSGFCKCSSKFTPYADRTCGRPIVVNTYGGNCNSSHTCNPLPIFHCSESEGSDDDRVCSCPPNGHMFYEDRVKGCVSGVGSPGPQSICDLKPIRGIQRQCPKHAACLPRPGIQNNDVGYCTCIFGFVSNADSTCGLPRINQPFNHVCNATWSCNTTAQLTCNSKTEKCDCKYEEDMFDISQNQCTSPNGGVCYTERVEKEIRSCTRDSRCVRGTRRELPYGRCRCNLGYTGNSTGHCVGSDSNQSPTTHYLPTTPPTPTSKAKAENFTYTVRLFLLLQFILHFS